MSQKKHVRLGQLAATAICGNDILSSALYVSGIAILFAGIYAPLILLAIVGVLYLYKKVYTEVVESLPINGGAYNCLLNGTSKNIAAIAGVMTFLSYIATAVISAKVGVEYLNKLLHFEDFLPHISLPLGFEISPIMLVTIIVLFAFAMLVVSGVKDSARVAIVIFLTHILTLTLFLAFGLLYFFSDQPLFFSANLAETSKIVFRTGGLLPVLFLAYSASLLGVSGFESSANFVEEQDQGVFRKTLRNMLIGVAIFNPLIALAVLMSMPYEAIVTAKDFLLADAALAIGGSWFQTLVIIDAFFVLCGAVLTGYVGVSGLMHRMSADVCIPSYFGRQNAKGSFPRIVISFFLLCSSILIVTRGDLLSLAGVYTIAFLGVMSLFAVGNLILKESRGDLKRSYVTPVSFVFLALISTVAGVVGNVLIDPKNLSYFAIYFLPAILLVMCVIYQDRLFKLLLRLTKSYTYLHQYINSHFNDVTEGRFVAFIHQVSRVKSILEYIDRNETGWNITFVHCLDESEESRAIMREIQELIPKIQAAGFYPYFKISFLEKNAVFGPDVIREVSKELKIHPNRILIGSIHHSHDFDYQDLGGVRIIAG